MKRAGLSSESESKPPPSLPHSTVSSFSNPLVPYSSGLMFGKETRVPLQILQDPVVQKVSQVAFAQRGLTLPVLSLQYNIISTN